MMARKFLIGLVAFVAVLAAWTTGTAQAQTFSTGTGLGSDRILGYLKAVNMNSTADQAIPLVMLQSSKYRITDILVTNCTGTLTIAAGGFYTASSKGGTAIVASGQAYSSLSSSTTLLLTTLAVTNSTYSGSTIYMSLTTAAGGAATCDAYIVGYELP